MKNFCHVSWGPGFPFPVRVLIFIACGQLLSEQWEDWLFTYSWVQETHVCTQSSASAVQGTHRDGFGDHISSCYAHVWVCAFIYACMHVCVCVYHKWTVHPDRAAFQRAQAPRDHAKVRPTNTFSFLLRYTVLRKDEHFLKHPENAAVGLICVPAFFFS